MLAGKLIDPGVVSNIPSKCWSHADVFRLAAGDHESRRGNVWQAAKRNRREGNGRRFSEIDKLSRIIGCTAEE